MVHTVRLYVIGQDHCHIVPLEYRVQNRRVKWLSKPTIYRMDTRYSDAVHTRAVFLVVHVLVHTPGGLV